MRGRLNLFQAAMLRWRELHPYNAVHVAELPQPFDATRLADAIASHLTEQGLTGLTLDVTARQFEYRGGPAQLELTVLPLSPDPDVALDVEMARQLNRPFPVDGAFDPFRFFALPTASTFHLGIAYDHFVAGGDSIVVLLKGIAARYAGTLPASFGGTGADSPTFAAAPNVLSVDGVFSGAVFSANLATSLAAFP